MFERGGSGLSPPIYSLLFIHSEKRDREDYQPYLKREEKESPLNSGAGISTATRLLQRGGENFISISRKRGGKKDVENRFAPRKGEKSYLYFSPGEGNQLLNLSLVEGGRQKKAARGYGHERNYEGKAICISKGGGGDDYGLIFSGKKKKRIPEFYPKRSPSLNFKGKVPLTVRKKKIIEAPESCNRRRKTLRGGGKMFKKRNRQERGKGKREGSSFHLSGRAWKTTASQLPPRKRGEKE